MKSRLWTVGSPLWGLALAGLLGFQQISGTRFTGGAQDPGPPASLTDAPPSYAGDPNPHEPGELEPAAPEHSGGCDRANWLRSRFEQWANGIYAFSGEVYRVETDMRVRGRKLDFVWARKYRSQVGPDTAQGVGWDFSYNIWVEASGADLLLHNGFGRTDLYVDQLDGTWQDGDTFDVLSLNPDDSYTLTFPDRGEWNFAALDGAPAQGKLQSIVDRNGNAMSFGYDGAGRLTSITDDLNRAYSIAYRPDGRIQSVSDFTGRQVVYDYYANGDPGGSDGDLKSARSPIVVGTPNGNDFPMGKTTVYTYTTGSADEFLNHNLLTVTDPKGQTFLQYEYATTVDRADLQFDRAVGQTWGDPGDRIDLHYEAVPPDASNQQAVVLTVLNDRRGLVKEVYSDAQNRLVMCREFTGFANPDTPTTSTTNRPRGKLRLGDPNYYETRWSHNSDGKITTILHPELNEVQFVYDETNASRRSQGNLLERRELPGPRGGDQAVLEEFFEYETDLGGCCGTNFVKRHVDARGNETLHTYDASGNRTTTTHRIPSIVEEWEWNGFGQMTAHVHPDNGSGDRRRDEFTYYPSGPNAGYQASMIEDVDNFADVTLYQYNTRGALTRLTYPSGGDELFARNQLDQVVQYRTRAVMTPGGAVRHGHDVYFDANDKIVRIDVLNIDENGNAMANAMLTRTYDYETLNEPVRVTREIDPSTDAVTEFVYDENRNEILTRHPEAVNGADPDNVVQMLYDERDLLYRETRAPGASVQSTTQHDYDMNRSRSRTARGIEGTAHVAVRFFDGYDRVVLEVDPMGNEQSFTFDANGNVLARQLMGELVDVPGGAGNQLLEGVVFAHDAMDRRTREDKQFFDTITGTPIDDGLSTTTWTYSDASQPLSVTNDNGNALLITYDSKLRVRTRTDAVGNVVEFVYDGNDNVLQTLETDSSTSGAADQVFLTTRAYDSKDRLVSTTDNVGNTESSRYDSRDNLVRTIDALGNVVVQEYDGLDRETSVERILTDTGTGSGMPIGSIVTRAEFDDSSRVVARIDDNGNRTEYQYDALDRRTVELFADGTSEVCTYDVHDNEVTCTDPNGTVTMMQYDLADRHIRTDVLVLGAGVSSDTSFIDTQYDGMGRVVLATDDDSVVSREYDSLSNLTWELLNGQAVSYTRDGVGNALTCQYPGGRQLVRTFDAGERVQAVEDAAAPSTEIAGFEYVGQRIESTAYGNGVLIEYTYNGIAGIPNGPGDFGVRRMSRMLHTNTATLDVVEDRRVSWDRVMNSIVRRDTRAGGPGIRRELVYDSAYRLVESDLIDPTPQSVREVQYTLDGAQNRTIVTGGLVPGAYSLDATMPDPADSQVNQYTTTPFDNRAYDQAGNLTSTGPVRGGVSRTFVYDCRNQLVRVENHVTGEEHLYAHDALGRRIGKIVDALGASGPPTETRFYYCGEEVCEEQDATGATLATYVLGPSIDRPVQMQRSGQDFYYHADDLGSVWSVSDATGVVVERYEYTDNGQPIDPSSLLPLNFPPASSNVYAFHGRRWCAELGLYWFRSRYMDSVAGRFISSDRLGAWGDPLAGGNRSAVLAASPWTYQDPSGTVAVAWGIISSIGSQIGVGANILRCSEQNKDNLNACADGVKDLSDAERYACAGEVADCCVAKFEAAQRDCLLSVGVDAPNDSFFNECYDENDNQGQACYEGQGPDDGRDPGEASWIYGDHGYECAELPFGCP